MRQIARHAANSPATKRGTGDCIGGFVRCTGRRAGREGARTDLWEVVLEGSVQVVGRLPVGAIDTVFTLAQAGQAGRHSAEKAPPAARREQRTDF